MALGISGVLFAIYFANVVLGSFFGAAFLDDVGEMQMLFASCIVFVIAILKREAARKNNQKDQN